VGGGFRASSDNPWDALSDFFDTSKSDEEIPAGAADNILIAWPVVFRFLDSAAPEAAGKRALDFGCGGGGFAHALHERGYEVTGIDPSPAMIERARAAYGQEVEFRVGDATLFRGLAPFSVITSIMALQFVADIERAMGELAAALEPGGHLVFAVHHPGAVEGDVLHFGVGVDVPIYVRTAEEYHALARSAGLAPVLEEVPPFTEEFVARYPGYAGQPPEYLILGYEKG
jgi:2-polyprenyl-3-methyl-5-hydroxy-6-metoxy-1,4-benzoquinol methylase